jgi:hypothetical protein
MNMLFRIGSLTGFLFGIVLLAGCTTVPVGPTPLPSGKIALVPARFNPEIAFNAFAKGKGHAAGKLGSEGAAEGALVGVVTPLSMGPLGLIFYPYIAPFTILAGALIGGAAGAGYGAMHGLPADQAATASRIVNEALTQINVHEAVSRCIEIKAQALGWNLSTVSGQGPINKLDVPNYSALMAAGYDGVLEISVQSIGMVATKGDPPRIALEMKLRTRIVSDKGNGVSAEPILVFKSRPHPIPDWAADNGKLLAEQFNQGYETLAQYTVEVYFPPVVSSE